VSHSSDETEGKLDPEADISKLIRTVRILLRAVITGYSVIAILAIVGVFALGVHITHEIDQHTRGACTMYSLFGQAPIPSKPPPAPILVRLVASGRTSFVQSGCPGSIGPPSPTLVKYAREYRVPLPK
jgi:hypothetical protein